MCSEDDQHIILSTGRETPIDVVPSTMMYFKVSVVNKVAPGRVVFNYGNMQTLQAVNTGANGGSRPSSGIRKTS